MSMSAILIISINKASLNEHTTYWMSGESLPMLMLSLGTSIIVFSRPPQVNNFITLISKGIFDVYLIHMNHFVYLWLWNEIFHIQKYYKSPLFAIKLVGAALLVFFVCLTIGNLRRLVSDYLDKKIKIVKLEKLYKKIDLTLNLEKERG